MRTDWQGLEHTEGLIVAYPRRDVEMAALATVMMREVEGVARRINGVWYGSPGNIGIIRGIELVMNHPDFKKIVEMLVSTADTGIYGSRFPALPDRDRVRPFVRLGMNQPLPMLDTGVGLQ